MTAFRKVIVVFYMVLVTAVVGFPILDGLGVITMKDGSSWLIAQIVAATAVPVALAVLKTKDFFRDDPQDVATAKKQDAEVLAKTQERHAKEVADLKAEYAKLNVEHEKLKRRPAYPKLSPATIGDLVQIPPGLERAEDKETDGESGSRG